MAATSRLSGQRRLLNALVRTFLRVGLKPRRTYVLTVRGRRSDTPDSTPVRLVEEGTHRWLVAPSGEVTWVRNARPTGQLPRQTLHDAFRADGDEAAVTVADHLWDKRLGHQDVL